MTTFNVLASTAYRLSITEPTVAGNPAPTISYAWSYNGTPIGGNNRIVNAYTFPSLPGTLSCTVTAANWGGSVSETATATIAEQQPVPVLNPVSIRVASSPTVIVTDLPDATAGTVLMVGGDRPAVTAPTGTNIGTLSYQWRRNGNAIDGATAQTYTLVASDIDTTVSVEVTAINVGESDTEFGVVRVGNATANADSRIGGHAPSSQYFDAAIGFANLVYSSFEYGVSGPSADGWGANATGRHLFGTGPQARLSMIGVRGEWDINNITYQDQFGTEYGIEDNYRVKYKVTVYWEGSEGRGQATQRSGSASNGAIVDRGWPPINSAAFSTETVQFANGDPFGEGVTRNFYKRTTEFGPVSVRALGDHELQVYENGSTDPFRNAIILVHDVQREVGGENSGVWETVYAGFTHENYTPFALYPTYVEAMRHFKVLRYLDFNWANIPSTVISQTTGEAITGYGFPSLYSDYLDLPPTFNTLWGFGNLNRPTHARFGRSIRAACELCSALGCDLWWNHPYYSTYVGNTPGEVKLREAYFALFAETINQHLAPGLKVYSEWGNESWNSSTTWGHGYRYAQNQSLKLTNSDGDLLLRDYTYLWASNPPWWANTMTGDFNTGLWAYNAASSATIAAYLRPRMLGRELIAVWGSQDAGGAVPGFAQRAGFCLWHTMPWVFDELDAYAVAPYRTPPVDNAAVEAGALTTEDAFDAIQSAGWLLPASDTASRWYSTPGSFGSDKGKLGFIRQKEFCLDLIRTFVGPSDTGKRRWNLRLVGYECGQEALPSTNATKEFTRRLQYEPRYYDFYYRHYETLFAPGPAPMVTARQDGYFGTTSQIIANGEPLFDVACDLSPIGPHNFKNDPFFWGTQQFNGEIGAPRATALKQLVLDQPWSSP